MQESGRKTPENREKNTFCAKHLIYLAGCVLTDQKILGKIKVESGFAEQIDKVNRYTLKQISFVMEFCMQHPNEDALLQRMKQVDF